MSFEQLSTLSPVVQILVGALLLVAGRRLFWLFVAVVGFLFGLQFGAELASGAQQWMVLLVAILIGLVAAVLAVFLQRLAIIIAGGAAGGLLAMRLATEYGMASPLPGVAFLIGAIIAAILAAMLFDWALIILSSLTGASLIVQSFALDPSLRVLIVIVLAAIGVAVQAGLRSRSAANSSP